MQDRPTALPLFENGHRVELVLTGDANEATEHLGFGYYVGPVPKTGYHAVAPEQPGGGVSIFQGLGIYAPSQLVDAEGKE